MSTPNPNPSDPTAVASLVTSCVSPAAPGGPEQPRPTGSEQKKAAHGATHKPSSLHRVRGSKAGRTCPSTRCRLTETFPMAYLHESMGPGRSAVKKLVHVHRERYAQSCDAVVRAPHSIGRRPAWVR